MPTASFDSEPYRVVGQLSVGFHLLDENLADLHIPVDHDTNLDHLPPRVSP